MNGKESLYVLSSWLIWWILRVHWFAKDDLISWLVDEAEGEDAKVENLVMRILFINFAAIHTTSMVCHPIESMLPEIDWHWPAKVSTHVLFDLAARPEYIEPMRKEAQNVIESEGWSKTAIAKLYKIDSFIHESIRYSSLSGSKCEIQTLIYECIGATHGKSSFYDAKSMRSKRFQVF